MTKVDECPNKSLNTTIEIFCASSCTLGDMSLGNPESKDTDRLFTYTINPYSRKQCSCMNYVYN